MIEILYKQESFLIIGACFEVYNQKGFGFTEPVYQECLQVEFAMQNIPFVAQPNLEIEYKGTLLTQFFKPDFICFGKIIVEIKSVAAIIDAHRAQAINYLNATKLELALLVNFGQHPKLEHERLAKSKKLAPTRTIFEEIGSWAKDTN
ncbi:MAG: GxxExxY protein [Pyrinomonadaceae bacterium]